MRIQISTPTAVALLGLILGLAGTLQAQPSSQAAKDSSELVASGVKKHRKPQKPPIELGTSGGNALDINVSGIPCISNTLGGLVQGDKQYILSTNGSLARRNDSAKGEPIIQPGLRDTKKGACNVNNPKGNTVGQLTKYKKLKFGTKKNLVDAAVAEVEPGMVDPQGSVIGIGVPGNRVVEPFLGQRVKKSGRGSCVKKGTVTAVNVTVDVDYLGRNVRFQKQFVIRSDGGKEIYTSGDSGAIFFEDRESCPGWVGLAVAGSFPVRNTAWASPMSAVLKQLQKTKPKGPLTPVGCNGVPGTEKRLSAALERNVRDAEKIQRRLERDVLRIPGVVGIGIGLADANPSEVVFKLMIHGDGAEVREHLPERLGKLRWELMGTDGASMM